MYQIHRLNKVEKLLLKQLSPIVNRWRQRIENLLTFEEYEILSEHITKSCRSYKGWKDLLYSLPTNVSEKLQNDARFNALHQQILLVMRAADIQSNKS